MAAIKCDVIISTVVRLNAYYTIPRLDTLTHRDLLSCTISNKVAIFVEVGSIVFTSPYILS